MRKDLSKEKYGILQPLEYIYNSQNGQSFWKCECECGNIKTIRTSRLISGDAKSCGCSRFISGDKHHSWSGFGSVSGTVILRARKGAESRGIEFNITAEYANSILESQNNKCALTGLDLIIPNRVDDFKKGIGTASIDRIDSSKGYIEGNIQWVHKDINFMKNDYNQNYFIEMCRKVAISNA